MGLMLTITEGKNMALISISFVHIYTLVSFSDEEFIITFLVKSYDSRIYS